MNLPYLALVVNGQPVALYEDDGQTILDAINAGNLQEAQARIAQLNAIPPAPEA